ncbi:MAG: OmpA family protein [Flavobacteriaceae bacterium]|nr:OmpA family protein [Flavobacteriaceae bacterium]
MKTNSVLQKILMSLLVTLIASTSIAQKNEIEKANKEFDKYSYIDAREIYLKVVEDGYASAQVYQKLGDTYYYNSDYENAAIWYQKLIGQFPSETESIYYYRTAQCLKSLGKYEAADLMMDSYSKLGGANIIINNYKEDPDYLKSIAFKAKGYEVQKTAINTNHSDFGTSYYGDKIVFASATKNTEGAKTFAWDEEPFLDLFEANRDMDGNLSNVTSVDGDVNTRYHESSAAFTKDGQTMYFTRNNFYQGKKGRDKSKTIRLKIYKAIKSGDNFWTNIEELPFNGDNFSVAHPALSVDNKKLYFASDMPGTFGMSDIWYVDINEDGTYGIPVNLGPNINTEAREGFPFISEMNNLYFSSDGHSGLGGLDIMVSQLGTDGTPGEVTNLGEPANSKKDDFAFIIEEGKRIGYLSSNRDGDQGSISDEIYIVREKCEITITGLISNTDTGEPIADATVYLLDENNKEIAQVTSDENGKYDFEALAACDSTYTVRAGKDGCEYNEKQVKTPNKTGVINVNVGLDCDPCPPNDLGCRLALQPIYFDFDRYNIRPDAAIELAKILAAMRQYPELIIHIESHTDSRAPFKYNEVLSEKRAQSTLNWLVEKGIDRSRLTAKGYGERQLQNRCSDGVECTEEEHQLNRRSMFIIKN